MKSYTTTIGIEVHAELKTKSKMFCGCANNPHASEPNANVCPVCMAHPGTLPTVNKQAVAYLMQVGKAIGGTLAEYSEFDRKNYFYPDIPKAYQISQYQFPFVTGGEIAGIAITRVHLEEDTARSIHDQGTDSLVDFNRAGVPLMELVTEPVIHDSKTAGLFAKELQLLLRSLEVSDANMEKGEMRVEANISVSDTDTFGTKVEVKNLNSFKSVESAIIYETKRQIALVEEGKQVHQETRGWDENKGTTYSQRTKESADDYRYFPDPDIPKFLRSKIPAFNDSRIDKIIEKTPNYKRDLYQNLGIPINSIEVIISNMPLDTFFQETLKCLHNKDQAPLAANYVITDVLSEMDKATVSAKAFHAGMFAELIDLLSKKSINSRVAKDLLAEVLIDGINPAKIAEERGLMQTSDPKQLESIVNQILNENSDVVDQYKAGKTSVIQFLVGQGMKLTRGTANPESLRELLEKQMLTK